ncbi:MAG: type II toxin-antitoxin system HicB family antitoxin [Proteobacteria bacterium]|nr:type II toxin-antitoxin system HicB family antitoxin [Pseudomonadota bacterium]
MAVYIALLRKEPDRDYEVSFPDLPGCETSAPSLGTAHTLAKEVLEFHIEALVEAGTPIPAASSLEQIRAQPASRNAMAFPIEV